MILLCVSSDKKTVRLLNDAVHAYNADATVVTCNNAETAVYETDTREVDAILTVPTEKSFDGLAFARQVYEISPNTKVIFVSDSGDSAVGAFRARARGYLVRANRDAIVAELTDLKIGHTSYKNRKIEARAFGNFELYSGGVPIRFGRSKSKELLAYLVYRRGTGVSASELIVNLWEDKDVDRTTRSMLHNLLADVRKSLSDAHAEQIFSYERNCYRIIPEELNCDYFDYLEGKDSAKDLFIGEFLSGYEWSMYACGELETIRQKRNGD